MNTEQFEIIRVFSEGLGIELTINQISKHINKSYAFTNKYAHDLAEAGILNRKTVGSAILCSLNLQNEETQASLVYISMINRMNKKARSTISGEVIQGSELVFESDGHLYAVSCPHIKEKGVISVSRDEFRSMVKSLDYSSLVILKGYDSFWKTVSEVLA